jgi:hypothetical protein
MSASGGMTCTQHRSILYSVSMRSSPVDVLGLGERVQTGGILMNGK